MKKFISCLCLSFLSSLSVAQADFARVQDTGVLRCGYQYWDGGVEKNEKTGELTGFVVEFMEKAAERLEWDIEWVGPTEWSNMTAELNADKVDAFCAGNWLSGRGSKFMLFSDPIGYNGFEAFVRADDNRFDEDVTKLNDSNIKLAIIEGTASGQNSKLFLPEASVYVLPPLAATDVDIAMSIVTGKADVGFTSPGILHKYMKTNPNKIKRVKPGASYAYMGMSIVFHEDDFRLWHVMNTINKELFNAGYTRHLIEKYNAIYPGLFVVPEVAMR